MKKIYALMVLFLLLVIQAIQAQPISGDIVYSQAIDPSSYTINTSLTLKNNPINMSVSGTPTCSIPIEIPNGTNGLQPNLSLNYTGNFIPDIFGTGWNIGGLSMISRVKPNIYHDNQSDPIEGKFSDRYALDGNRLIVVNGTYGSEGSEYRTEKEEFSKVVAYGTSSEGPLYFIVYTKSGLICEYGNSTDSRLILTEYDVLYWKINKISDRYGNYMTFKYIPSDDEYPIEKIEYTGNTSQNIEPFVSINFHYKKRSNFSIYTIGEVKFQRDILLTDINITNNGQFFKKYELDYCENKGYPLLQKVTEYSSQNQMFNPQIFTYTKQTEQFSTGTNPYSASVKERIYQGDFNGDGRMDIVTVPLLTDESLNKKWKVYVANSLGNFYFFWEGNIMADANEFTVADFNGDGLSDFIQINYEPSADVYFFPSTGTGFGNPYGDDWSFSELYPNIYVVDYNGDGILEVMGYRNEENAHYELRSYSGELIHEGTITGTGSLPPFSVGSGFFQIQDFNGDGCSDLLTLDDAGFKMHEFKGTNNKLKVTLSGDKLKNTYSLRYGDFNGDGTTDILRTLGPTNPEWSVVICTRYGFKEQGITGLPNFNLSFTNNQWYCCDLNGDGKMDVILWGKGTTGTPNKIYAAINKVNGFEYSLQEYTSSVNFDMSGITPDNPLYFYFGDFDGDTREEFFYSKPGYQRRFSFASGTISNLLRTTIDGLGAKTSLTYLPSSDWSVYKAGIRPDYPLANYTKAIQLVSAVSLDNGIGGNTTVSYNYNGAKVHLQGKGFLGFSQTTETNNATGIMTVKTVEIDQTYYYPQLSSVITMYNATNTVLTNAGGSWNELDFGNKRFFSYLASSVEIDELTKLLRFKSEEYFADGNLKSVTTNFSRGPTRTKEFLYNDERVAEWLIGRPTTITERSMGISGTRTFVTNRSYFSTNNSPDIDQYNTGDPSAWTLDREYDTFGNLWKEHRSATGLSTRTKTYTYDSNGVNLLSVTDPVGRVNSYTYVPATGLISTQTDPFGNLTTYNYNSADQLNSIERDGGITTTFARSLNVSGGPTNARYYILETGSDGSQVRTWYDRLERPIRNENKSFSGTMIKVDQQYNTKGQLYRISEPTTGTPSNWNITGYDNYGRVISEDPYYGATTSYSYADSVITRTVNGRNYTSTVNSAGLIEKRTDPGGTIRYIYYPDGLLKSTLTSDNVSTVITYDRNGNRLSIDDPSAGVISNTWYGTGEVNTQQSARGLTKSYTYRTDGLVDYYTSSPADEGVTNYTYNADGQVTGITSPGGVSCGYTYDTRGRVGTVTESIDGVSNTVTFNYDTSGRLYRKYFDGTTDYEQYDYNANGYLYRIQFNGTTVWQLTTMDNYRRIRQASIGGTTGTWTYDGNNMLSQIAATGLQQYDYSFNVNTGNLNYRTNFLQSKTENFGYDALGLDRLTSVSGPSAMSANYGSNGNILAKSDAGTGSYAYNNTPYAVSSIAGAQNIPTIPQDIDYYSFEKVKKITEGTKTADFIYNADQQRIRMILKDNGTTTKTRWYFGGSQEREQVGSTTTQYIWIGGDAYTAVAVARRVGSGSWEVFSIFRDHLGTITHLKSGSTVYEYSFDAWGRRRDKDDWTYNLSGEPALFAGRGFTAHEHLDDFSLINMNGRLYDPVVGRFLSPDAIVQSPDFTQGFNRYSYVLNNPLKYTDPSGYTWWSHFWNWVGEGFDNLGDWMNKTNIQFQVGINMSGSGTVPFANVAGPNGVNMSAGYNMENDMLGIGTNRGGFTSFWYPSYNYNAPVENAYASIESGMNEWYAKNGGGNSNSSWLYGAGVVLYTTGNAATGGELFLTNNISFFHSMNRYSAPVGLSYTREISLLTKATRGIRAIGGATIFIGGVLGFGFGVPNYYKYGHGDPRSVSPGKAGLNLGVGVYSLSLNPIVAPVYFGVDSFYPGGWPGALQDQNRLIQKNQSILGPGWNLYKDIGGF